MREPLRIGLNLLHAIPEIGGGWNYIERLIAALAESDNENTYFAYTNAESEWLVPTQRNFVRIRANLRAVRRPQRILYENTLLQLFARKHHLSCMHWFANTQAIINIVPAVVTVHDLKVFVDPASFLPLKRAYLRLMMSLTARRRGASVLLPVSSAAAQELTDFLGVEPHRIVVVPFVPHRAFRPAAPETVDDFRSRHSLPRFFWLYVAHTFAHKNHTRLLEGYRSLRSEHRDTWPLVLRGDTKDAEAVVVETIQKLGLMQYVIRLPRIDYLELPALYSAATAFVFPSLYEGAGIPVLEALACGCPVTTSGLPSVREYAGDAALYFDATLPESIKDAMARLQADPRLRADLCGRGLEQAARYTAADTADKLLHAYRVAATHK